MQPRFQLLRILSDGHFHSGETLGATLGMGRSAVWKHLKTLAEWDIVLHAVSGKGYRLAHPLELLDRDAILCFVTEEARALLPDLEIHHDIDSTNRYLTQKGRLGAPSGQVCLAERQQAGRGRRGRTWISPFGANIYLSVLWRFALSPESLSGLGLAVGVAVTRALQDAGMPDVELKWPNDILWQGRKLAGILLEMTGELSGSCSVVVGIGLNVRMPRQTVAMIDQPWVDMETALDAPVSRNEVAGRLLRHLALALRQFEADGLSAFHDEWMRLDAANGKPVTLQLHNDSITGVGRGIDASGALILDDNGVIRHFPYGEVSLRMVS